MAGEFTPTAGPPPVASETRGSLATDEPTAASINPPRGREVAAAGIWTLLADALIFRGEGYAGPAIFLVLAPLLFLGLFPEMLRRTSTKWTLGILLVVVARLLWSGSPLTIFSGVMVIVAVSMVAAGGVPLVLEGFALASQAIFRGMTTLARYQLPKHLGRESNLPAGSLSVLLPLAAAAVFGSIFVFANPDLLDRVSTGLATLGTHLIDWLGRFSPWELPFCILALLVGIGLMRPATPMLRFGSAETSEVTKQAAESSQWYAAFRNTLITMIVLFVVYLGFEWVTLWKREFPAGFYYAGYAHQGAAWLTIALALATGMLSLIFRGSILADPRLHSLRRLAWIWSGANLLLAVAVYNRLSIYVGYNGMTRMRMIGFFGITLVVVGFVLVLYKIGRQKNFWWLIRSQLLAFALAVIAYSVFPVDYVAHRYNAAQVANGHLHPAVMIAVKPIDDEGISPLLNLVDCPNRVIRGGVRAILAERQATLESQEGQGWTAYQGSSSRLRRVLRENESKWSGYTDPKTRQSTINNFREYAMKWY